ncbi:MAG: pantoate--beta-alanine ligase [Armatimonadota bacterium]|nr:MAG: pantoate--beta-alanine ligase [Armatimonadota bacterium]
MRIITSVAELRELLAQARGAGKSIGLVPTMGYFHEGHLSLMRQCRESDDVVVVSLFVNPTQFGPGEDYEEYPRDPERDAAMAQEVGVDVLFTPSAAEMYPPGDATFVEVTGELTAVLCGARRPGHFRGVATVVTKLFNIVRPNRAYFGEKDYQQLLVVRRLTQDLRLPVEIVAVRTVREPDGLAMSSRNTRLGPKEREAATVLYRSLRAAQELASSGARDAQQILARVREIVAAEPLATLQYAELRDAETLAPVEHIAGRAVLALAAHVGGVRLIDNLIIAGG